VTAGFLRIFENRNSVDLLELELGVDWGLKEELFIIVDVNVSVM
jgi:hypothetical protein